MHARMRPDQIRRVGDERLGFNCVANCREIFKCICLMVVDRLLQSATVSTLIKGYRLAVERMFARAVRLTVKGLLGKKDLPKSETSPLPAANHRRLDLRRRETTIPAQ